MSVHAVEVATAEPVSARKPRADALRNRARLVEAARGLFASRGADTSMEEIARTAGVGIGTLYRHFPTRDAVIEAVYRREVEQLAAAATRLLDSHAPGEALHEWLRLLVDYIATKKVVAQAISPAVHLEFIQTQAGLSEAQSVEEIEAYHRALFLHHHAAELEKYEQQTRVHQDRLDHLDHRLKETNSKLSNVDALIAVDVDGGQDVKPTLPWNGWDRAMFVAALIGIVSLLVFGVLNISFNLLESGLVATGGTAEEFATFVQAESRKWAKLAKERGLRAE